jgi:hypothetical protein
MAMAATQGVFSLGQQLQRGVIAMVHVINCRKTKLFQAQSGRCAQPAFFMVQHYDSVSINRRALRTEGNGPVVWSGLQTKFPERPHEKNASAQPSTKDIIGAVCLGAFAPPGSPVDRYHA